MTLPAADAVQLIVRAASAEYPIHITPGISDRVGSLLDVLGVPHRRFVISSTTVWRLHANQVINVHRIVDGRNG